MDSFNPFSLRYHNRDGGSAAAPVRRVPISGDIGDFETGDPFSVQSGVPTAYSADDGVFGIALYPFDSDDYVTGADKDGGDVNHVLTYPTVHEANTYRVQAKKVVSNVALAIDSDVLGNVYDLDGSAGEMYLDVSAAGTDFLVIDIEETVSDWDDKYPILIVQCINPQLVDPSI